MTDYTPLEQWLYDTGFAMPGDVRRVARQIEASDWLAAHDAALLAESAERVERTSRGARTLGGIIERQIEDTLRWAGMEDQIGTDDPDQQLAWERCAEMPGRIAELEAEVAALRCARDATNGWPET